MIPMIMITQPVPEPQMVTMQSVSLPIAEPSQIESAVPAITNAQRPIAIVDEGAV